MIHVAVRRAPGASSVALAGDRRRRAARGRRAWTPERAAPITGVAGRRHPRARDARSRPPSARCSTAASACARRSSAASRAWLCYALNALTGHLDEPGGLMFTTPAVDPLPLAGAARLRRRLRALARAACRGKPEFGGELPVTALAEEIETPGDGQIRALITSAGNPVLSAPGGPRLETALGQLDFMVSIDPYLNETTRHAHVILPPTSPLERSHYDLALNAFAVRNVAKYSPPLFERARRRAPRLGDLPRAVDAARRRPPPVGARGSPSACSASSAPRRSSTSRCAPARTAVAVAKALARQAARAPARHRSRPARAAAARPARHAGPARCTSRRRSTSRDLPRLERAARRRTATAASCMIGRRHLRSNNSWMHNSERLVKGPPRCTLLIHPDDAARARARRRRRARGSRPTRGAIELPVEITDAMMPGVVSVPHGWGHHRTGARLSRRGDGARRRASTTSSIRRASTSCRARAR